MSRCIICNQKIQDGTFFCDNCLVEEAGEFQKPLGFSGLSSNEILAKLEHEKERKQKGVDKTNQ